MPKSPVYLDYHATTPCDPQVIEAMLPYFGAEKFGNADAVTNAHGRHARQVVIKAKENIAALLGGTPEAFTLTSSATEANHMALCGLDNLREATGRHEILISAIEHSSILNCVPHLQAQGYDVKIIPVNKDGMITPEILSNLISDKTLLVSVMAANHEIGTIQPIEEIAELAHKYDALFHCDATQAAGKIPLDIDNMKIDLLSLSAHKFYGPQGIGALYIHPKPPLPLSPLFYSNNQKNLRSGTIPLALAVGFGEACQIAKNRMTEDENHLQKLTRLMLSELQKQNIDFKINGMVEADKHLAGSLNLRFPDKSAEDIMLSLSNDLSLSMGSACTSQSGKPSAVLKAIGLSDTEIASSLRLSFGRPTTEKDVLYVAGKLASVIRG